ncbi:MAG: GTP 3',8-cyclase MoaA [Defluviitaleaceae bacterium]|nr:GTP 3',8-cyclase MoaA [Defluviitaleaceae bacterium]
MVDAFSRNINYLRISITDRCNLRCAYCMPEPDQCTFFPPSDILTYSEILRLCTVMAQLGVDIFRVTGGEPLVRPGCVGLIRQLKAIPGAKKVTLTTNGVLLGKHIPELVAAGIDGINVSLDSVCRDNYEKITGIDGRDAFDAVWVSIEKAVAYGVPTKINAVIIKGVNDHEILPLVAIAEKLPVNIRFIELMPTVANAAFEGVPNAAVLQVIRAKYSDLTPDSGSYGAGPARYYQSPQLMGKIGFISPVNHNFCESCNRIRLSSTGFLLLCLHHAHGIDLRAMLRGGASDEAIKEAIVRGTFEKPQRHFLESETNLQDMSKVGG